MVAFISSFFNGAAGAPAGLAADVSMVQATPPTGTVSPACAIISMTPLASAASSSVALSLYI